MLIMQKKVVIDDPGRPQAVIISWHQYQLLSEMIGLDLDEEAIGDLRQAQRDRAAHNRDAHVNLDAIGG